MKRIILFVLLLSTSPLFATTWYVRSDGGTRFSTIETTGQCNGQANASYASTGGTGINQNCAFSDIRYLWADGSYSAAQTFPGWGWVIAGGDTAIVRDCIQYSAPATPIPGSSGPCRIGYSGPNSGNYFLGVAGDPGSSGMPPPPNGTSGAHTQILGANYASCASPSAKTLVHGGYGTGGVMSLSGASYVDIACFDITDYSSCGRSGNANQCQTSYPLDDYANNGVTMKNTSTNDSLTDISIHGMAANGMAGPTGTGFVVTRVSVIGDSSSGWNLDPGDGTTGTGSLTMRYFSSMWNGCNEEYPIVDATPYTSCSDDGSGGYGDGWGTATVTSSPGWQVSCDHCTFAYNTQDGYDALHVGGTGSTVGATNSLFYGNMGNQLKIGGSAPTVVNNLIYGNCNALRNAVPGTPAQYSSFSGTQGLDVAFTGTSTIGSNVITVSTTTGIQVGFHFYGTNMPVGATVTAVDSVGGTITISGNAAVAVTESMDASDPVLTGVSVVSGTVTIGRYLGGAGIRPGTYVVSYDSTGNTVTLSQGISGSTGGTSFTQQYNSALGDFCRAGDDAIATTISNNYTSVYQFNTVISANSGAWLVVCSSPCTAPVMIFQNNILEGFKNNAANGYPGGGNGNYVERLYFDPSVPQGIGVFTNPGSLFSYNADYNEKDPCPNTHETNYICGNPGLTDQNWYLYGTWTITPASAASAIVGAGTPVAGITTDYAGNTRSLTAPTIGAYEFVSDPSTTAIFGGSAIFSGNGTF